MIPQATFRLGRSRFVAVALAVLGVVAWGFTPQAKAANWTAVLSSNWANPGFDGTPQNVTNFITNNPRLDTLLPLASTTATLVQSSTTQTVSVGRTNYDFTVAPGSGFSLDWTTGIFVYSDNTTNNNPFPSQANRTDFTVTAPVRVMGNWEIQNGGAAGTVRMMGDISQDSGARAVTAQGNVVFGGSNSYQGTTTLTAGNVVLDYDNSNSTKFWDSSSLTFNGGNVSLTLKGGAHTEAVSAVTFANGAVAIRRSGGSSTLSAGGLTFSAGSAVDFGLDGLVTTSAVNTRGIIGDGVARATVGGASWATVTSGSSIVGLTNYATDVFTSNTNTDVTTTQSQSAVTTNTLRFNTAGSNTLTLSGANTLQGGGILVTPNVGTATTTISGGTLAPSVQMVIHQHNTAGRLDIDSNINMAQGLVKTGSGTVRFSNSAANSGAGASSIHQGTVELNTSANVFGTGAITFDGGEIHNVVGGNVTISNPVNLGPPVSRGWNVRVGFGGVSSGTITLSNTVAIAGSSALYKQLQVNVANGVTLLTTGSLVALSGDAAALEKTGGGTWSVTGAVNQSGFLSTSGRPLVVREGVMRLAGLASISSAGANLWGGKLELNNETTNNNDRLNGINAFGGELGLVGNASAATNETIHTVFVRAGHTTLTVESKGQVTDLSTSRIGQNVPGGVEQEMGTTMLVRGSALGSGSTGSVARIVGNLTTNGMPSGYSNPSPSTTAARVIPWMLADDTVSGSGKTIATFVTTGAGGNGYRPLNLSGTGVEVLTSDAATTGQYYFSGSGTTTVAAARTWRSIQLVDGRTLAATSGTFQIDLQDQAVLSTGAANTIDSSIRLTPGAAQPIYFHTVSDLNVKGAITNANGAFVKSSAGTLTISGTSDRSTGNTFVNQGVLKISSSNALYNMSTFTGTSQINRVITVWGRPGSDAGVLELAGINWTTGTSRTPGIVLSGNNATLRGSGTASYGNGGFAFLSAYGDVFLEASGTGTVLTLNSPISRDSGLATSINVKGAGRIELGAGAGNARLGTSRGNAEMDWYIGGSRNGNQGWLAVNATGTVGVSTNTIYVGNGGILSGTGTLGSPVIVQGGGVLSPGNSPGIETFASGLTLEGGGQYVWEINNWAGQPGTGYDQLAVTGLPLNITATSGSTYKILITSLTAGNAAGAVPGFDPYANATFRIATAYSGGGVTNFSADKFTLDWTTAFSGYNANSGTFSLTSTGTSLDLNYWRSYASTTYTLAASTNASAIRVGGTASITVAATNTGTGAADSLAVTGLGVAVSPSGSVTIAPTSGTAALAAAVSGSGNFIGGSAGAFTFAPTFGTANNANLGSPATLSGSSTTTVSVFNPAAPNTLVSPINLGVVLKNSSLTQALTISNTAPNNGFSERLVAQFGSTTGVATTNSGSVSLLAPQTSSTNMVVGLTTTTAGPVGGTVQVNFWTDGQGTSGLGQLALDPQVVTLSGTVLDRATPSFASETLTTGTTIDFGSWLQNAVVAPSNFSIFNFGTNAYIADLALTSFDPISAPFGSTLALFSDLAAGGSYQYQALFSTATTGTFETSYTLSFKSANGNTVFESDPVQTMTLTLKGVVMAVPEPGSLALVGTAGAMLGLRGIQRIRRRRRKAA